MKSLIKNRISFKIKIIALLTMMFICNDTLFTEAYNNSMQFKDITVDDGLSQSTVETLYQDSNGYIWIGTNDGYDLKKYKQGDDPSTNIASNYILAIKPYILLSPMAFLVYGIIVLVGIYLNRIKMKKLDKVVDKRTHKLREEMGKNNELLNKVINLEKNKNNYFVNLSHELRTPLNVISTTQQLILELNKKENGLDKERLNYHTKVMQCNTKRLLNLINNIIDTSKIEHGSYEINIKEYDVVYIVEETSLALKDYVESKNIELIIDPEVEEKIIECDRHEIERCIVNLISNAKKFTQEGGSIEVKLKDLGEYVEISVADSGIGIPKDRQKYIFERFNQVIDKNSEQKGGSGLGLAITKHIIDRHKGKLYLESEENKGSIFTIVLPVKINKK